MPFAIGKILSQRVQILAMQRQSAKTLLALVNDVLDRRRQHLEALLVKIPRAQWASYPSRCRHLVGLLRWRDDRRLATAGARRPLRRAIRGL